MKITSLKYFGSIKWFGGKNRQTGKENNFGFILDASGHDIYLNRNEWKFTRLPSEGDTVYYNIEERGGKFSALNASLFRGENCTALELYDSICSMRTIELHGVQAQLYGDINKHLCNILPFCTTEDIKEITDRGTRSIFDIILKSHHSKIFQVQSIFTFLLDKIDIKITDEVWPYLPMEIIENNQQLISEEFSFLDTSTALEKASIHPELPPSLVVFLIIKKVFTTTKQLGVSNSKRIYNYLNLVIFLKKIKFPEYLKITYDLHLDEGIASNPLLVDIIDSLEFKNSLFCKTTDYITVFYRSERLQNNIESFILKNIFSLITSGNKIDVIFTVFLQRLWEVLMSNSIDFRKQGFRLKSLFPTCQTMGPVLSCEAIYWHKENKYLCRSKLCSHPAVLPDTKKNYIDFSIYDWLDYYGVKYSEFEKPTHKDFPIKLAGYFNRIRELHDVIHCQVCANIMLPNMRYSRTEYMDWEDGIPVKKEMSAAYRLTVFHCNEDSCQEFKKDYYINHCVGCHEIIDSRNLKTKCSNGLYICNGCGGCCTGHKFSNPTGICPECTQPLEVRSKIVRNYTAKYVKCSSSTCGFSIDSANLPSKFKALTPVDNVIDM